MSQQLAVSMLGSPSMELDGAPLVFPYRQAEAILYYLFLNQSVNKYTLADLIWEDKCTEEKTNSNLRNAFYIIRKNLGKDFLVKGSGDMIKINPAFSLTLDTEQFLREEQNLSLYRGDFLEGFYLKNNVSFNEWVTNTRQVFKAHYLKKLHRAISTHFDSGNFQLCESLCHKQMQINEFDETAYKYLMQIYLSRKEYTQALHIYNRLESLLEQELFETPAKEIQDLALVIEQTWNEEVNKILEGRKELKAPKRISSVFYGRETELECIKKNLASLRQEDPVQHLLLLGEAGVGKTRLMQQALSLQDLPADAFVLSSRCYCAEEKYILKPWQKPARELLQYLADTGTASHYVSLMQSIQALFPFTQEQCHPMPDADDISTLDYKSIQRIFVNGLIRLSSQVPLIFFFDDIQWADKVSLSLMRDIITSLRDYSLQNLIFLFTARSSLEGEAERFTEDMCSIGQLKCITVNRFDYHETVSLASRLLPGYVFTDSVKEQLFHETEGNALFITEAVNTIKYHGSPDDITPNMRNIIKQRVAPIPGEYRQILNLVSIFFDGVSYDCLSSLSRKEDYELVEILEYLLNKDLLKENMDRDNTFFSFSHQKIMEYVYDEMSWTKKRILHNKAGRYLESRLCKGPADMALYPKLIFHFERGANRQKYLKYAVKYLYNYLNVTHEFFPIIGNNLTLFTLDMREETSERLSDDLSSIEELLYTVENKVNESSFELFDHENSREEQLEILSDYLHMIGRHYIRICSYEKGLYYILKLKELNQNTPSPFRLTKLLQANRQLICVYINRYEPDKMEEVVRESLGLLEATDFTDEVAIWKRLQGLGDIMKGSLKEGISHLQDAIKTFSSSPARDEHLYNLAAAYSWIGEAFRHSMEYEKAMEYYHKALEIGGSNFLVSGVSVFYAYAGMAAYDSGNLCSAKEYLTESIARYEQGNLMWGRSLPYSYYAQILLRQGEYEEALKNLETALGYAAKLENPYEMGIIYRIYAQIKTEGYPVNALSGDTAYYYDKARELLQGVYSPVDERYLAAIAESIRECV